MEDCSEDPRRTGTPSEAVGGLWVGKGPERGFLNSRSLSSRSWLVLCAQLVTLNSFPSSRLQPSPRRTVQGPGMRQKAQGDQEGPGEMQEEKETEKGQRRENATERPTARGTVRGVRGRQSACVSEGAYGCSLLTQEGRSQSPWNPGVKETGSRGAAGEDAGETGQEPGMTMEQAGSRSQEKKGVMKWGDPGRSW